MNSARVLTAARLGRMVTVVRALAEPLERRLLLSAADYSDLYSRAVVVNNAAITLYNHQPVSDAAFSNLVNVARALQNAPVSVTPATLPLSNHQVIGTIATLHDPARNALPINWSADYRVTIDWGDGQSSTALLVPNLDATGFSVIADHTYASTGSFSISLAVERKLAPTDAGPRNVDVTTSTATPLKFIAVTAPPPAAQFLPPGPPPPAPVVMTATLGTVTIPADSAPEGATTTIAQTPAPTPAPQAQPTPIALGGYRLMESVNANANAGDDAAVFDGEFALVAPATPAPRTAPAGVPTPDDPYTPAAPTAALPPPPTGASPALQTSSTTPLPSAADGGTLHPDTQVAVALLPTPETHDKRVTTPARILFLDRSWKLALVLSAGTALEWNQRRRARKAESIEG